MLRLESLAVLSSTCGGVRSRHPRCGPPSGAHCSVDRTGRGGGDDAGEGG